MYKSLEHTKRKALLKKRKPTHQLEGATTTERYNIWYYQQHACTQIVKFNSSISQIWEIYHQICHCVKEFEPRCTSHVERVFLFTDV